MKNLIKQLQGAAEELAKEAVSHAEDCRAKIMTYIEEDLKKVGEDISDLNTLKEKYHMTIQELKRREGVLIAEAYVIGSKEEKKVVSAYVLKITYKPQGFTPDGALDFEIRSTVEEATGSFFYPEDDDSIFLK